jgi:putative transposase
MVSPQIRREQVLLACQRGLSQRHACGLIGIGRSALSYQARLPAKDAPVIAAMKMLSAQYPRYGYRRIRIFLRRQGFELGWSRTHRLWRQAGLLLPSELRIGMLPTRPPMLTSSRGTPRLFIPLTALIFLANS